VGSNKAIIPVSGKEMNHLPPCQNKEKSSNRPHEKGAYRHNGIPFEKTLCVGENL
jgi:hypothetical protein